MYTDRINNIINYIEEERVTFDMTVWLSRKRRHECSTTACIAGICLLQATETSPHDDLGVDELVDNIVGSDYSFINPIEIASTNCYDLQSFVADWLGITYEQAHELCLPDSLKTTHQEYEAAIAVKVLENLRLTGEVDWWSAIADVCYGEPSLPFEPDDD